MDASFSGRVIFLVAKIPQTPQKFSIKTSKTPGSEAWTTNLSVLELDLFISADTTSSGLHGLLSSLKLVDLSARR